MFSGIAGGINLNEKTINSISKCLGNRSLCASKISNIAFLTVNSKLYNSKEVNNLSNDEIALLAFDGKLYGCKNKKRFDIVNSFSSKSNFNEVYGKFAVAVAKTDGSILLARDYPGSIPLFYCLENNVFAFSTVYGLLEKIGLKKVQAVQPGTNILYKKGKISTINWYNSTVKNSPDYDAVSNIDNLFDETIKEIMSCYKNAPVGIMLSGGVDSALLSHYISKYTSNVYSYVMDGEDKHYGELVSKLFGFKINIIDNSLIEREKILFTSYNYNKQFENLNNSLFVPTYVIAKKANADNVKLLFSGDGIDELFGGYDLSCDTQSMNIAIRNMVDSMFLYSLDRLHVACNTNNVSVAVPFLHQKIIEAAFSIDAKYKQNKYLIRKIAEKYLPNNIAWREKSPLQVSTHSYELLYKRKWIGLHH
ncbi:MAG: hypothetical protein LBI55_00475 [Oscillospiraceae bacterium]|jgi:asparagine synthase (glutamine-hydrolysing)|nr:hypothetical protein [Oscillospiraceae bacterium]